MGLDRTVLIPLLPSPLYLVNDDKSDNLHVRTTGLTLVDPGGVQLALASDAPAPASRVSLQDSSDIADTVHSRFANNSYASVYT